MYWLTSRTGSAKSPGVIALAAPAGALAPRAAATGAAVAGTKAAANSMAIAANERRKNAAGVMDAARAASA
ncbi:hypothetical protein, partial [Roseateles sp.]|uniref:hypothetical protein n=1 Tax=Roseateles sp. TaxID=1971397 RepID=UPI0031D31FD9